MLSVELSQELEDSLKAHAKETNQSPEEVLVKALGEYLDRLREGGLDEDDIS